MEKFNFTPSEIFESSSGYPNPQNERETREQLSRPLKQVRDYINNDITPQIKEVRSVDETVEVKTAPGICDLSVDTYVGNKVAKLNQNIATNDKTINAKVDKIKTQTDTTIANNKAEVDKQLTNVKGRLNALETEQPTIKADITTNQGNIQTNTNNIATNKKAIATNTSNIQTNTSNIQTNKNNIATINQTLTNLSSELDIATQSQINTITSNDGSVIITGSGNTRDLQVVGGGGDVTKNYVDTQDQELQKQINTKVSSVTSNDNSIEVKQVGNKVDLKVLTGGVAKVYDAQPEAPTDQNILWIDTNDESQANGVINAKNVVALWSGTQSEYDLLPIKEETTIYFIKE